MDNLNPKTSKALQNIFAILLKATQVDFSNYKSSTIQRRIQRRMVVRKSGSLVTYSLDLLNNPNEVKSLYEDILINVTSFFRDPESYKVLQTKVFPEFLKKRKKDKAIRVWVSGCSSGEEVYSLAILWLEFQSNQEVKTPIQIFATDIDEIAVQKARAGIYTTEIEQSVSKERLLIFFDKVDSGYKIKKGIRDLCLFSKHNVFNDPPFSKLDLISCRNVLIYFTSTLQKRIMPLFHYALNPTGFLWLGRSEGPGGRKLFNPIDKVHKIYSKENIPTPLSPRITLNTRESDISSLPIPTTEYVTNRGDFQNDAEKMALSRYAPPFVVINNDMEILKIQGRIFPFLEVASGLATNNLFKKARREIVPELRMTIQSAKGKNTPARQEGMSLETDNRRIKFNIEVAPINPSASSEYRNYVIFFEEAMKVPIIENDKKSTAGKRGVKKVNKKTIELSQNQRIIELEEALFSNNQSQQMIVEEYETTQEELTSTNEELQSANEELQSSNEELETAKEELQSSLEELNTVNEELLNKNEELVVISSDLKNVLNSVDIPIVIVGNDLRVRRFTPKAEKVFNLIPGDVGRPLSNIKPNFELTLDNLVLEVIDTLTLLEREFQMHSGQWMRLQVRPYRIVDNRIDGVLISLVDITDLKEHLAQTQNSLIQAASIADTLPLPLVVLDENLRLLSANEGFSKMFEIVPDKDIGSDLLNVLGGKGWAIPRLRQLLSEVIKDNKILKEFEVENNFPELGHRIFLLNSKQIDWKTSMPKALLLSIDDITERRMLERSLELSEMRFRRVVDSAYDAIIIVNSNGIIEFANERTVKWFGYSAEEIIGSHVEILIPENFHQVHIANRNRYFRDATSRPMGRDLELFAIKKDRSKVPVDIALSPLKLNNELKVTAIIRDITERKKLLENEKLALAETKKSQADTESANHAKDLFLATLSHELRTPLSSILTWSQLISSGKVDFEQAKGGAAVIEQSAKTQSQLIDDLLDISRIIAGKLTLEIREVDLHLAIPVAVELVRSMSDKKSIQIETIMCPEEGLILADPVRLQQIIWNLLTNAVKFSPYGSKIEVQLEYISNLKKRFAQIKVIDHGKGIPVEFFPHLFNRFSQADSTSTRLHQGLGLGLSIVRNLVEFQGGTVIAENALDGKGAIFTVTFPVALANTAFRDKNLLPSISDRHGPKVEILAPPSLKNIQILVVDDDKNYCESLAIFFRSYDAIVMITESANEAMKLFLSFKPDIVISDIAMPVEDGFSLIQKIRALSIQDGRNTPVLALTAFATDEDAKRVIKAGFQAHIPKPAEAKKLAKIIFDFVGKKINGG